MDRNKSADFKGGFTIIGILIVLVIIALLFYKVLNVYFKKPPVDKETEKVLNQQGIDTANYQSIVDTTRDRIHSIETQHNKQLEFK